MTPPLHPSHARELTQTARETGCRRDGRLGYPGPETGDWEMAGQNPADPLYRLRELQEPGQLYEVLMYAPKTFLIVVTGRPGAGKPTLAGGLAQDLQLPVVSKDSIREVLFNGLGWEDREWAKRLGRASKGKRERFSRAHSVRDWRACVRCSFLRLKGEVTAASASLPARTTKLVDARHLAAPLRLAVRQLSLALSAHIHRPPGPGPASAVLPSQPPSARPAAAVAPAFRNTPVPA